MISAALRAMKFGYASYGTITPYLFPEKTHIDSPNDVQATLEMIRCTINTWEETDHMRHFVHDALVRAQFCFDTIRLKREKHQEKWFADWRSLSLDKDYKKLVEAIAILEKRFSIAVMGHLTSTHDPDSMLAHHANAIKRENPNQHA